MPDFVTVFSDVTCPHCGCVIDTSFEIQWGKVPGTLHIGEKVKWLMVDDQIVPPFTLLEGKSYWNCGDPTVETVFVFDCNRYAVDSDTKPRCPSCGKVIGGVMAGITSNILTVTKTYTLSEMRSAFGSKLGKADIIVLGQDGSYNIREDWFNHTIEYIKTRRG